MQKFVGRRTQNARTENFVQSQSDALALGGNGAVGGGVGDSDATVGDLMREVRELKALVQSFAAKQAQAEPSLADTFAVMFGSVLSAIFKTIFVMDSRMSIHRTAMILIAYLVVHVGGNLTFFGGPDLFNNYANFMFGLTIVKFVSACINRSSHA